MKLKNIAVTSAFVAGNLFAVVANATIVSVTSGGVTYNITTTNQQSYASDTSIFNSTAMPWWGNSSLAIDLANQVRYQLGYFTSTPSSANSPSVQFAYGTGVHTSTSVASVSIAYWSGSSSSVQDCPNNCPNQTSSYFWAILDSYGSTVNLAPNAYALRSVYNIQSAALNAGLSYDCNVFDKEGICLSTGGRYSTTNSPQATTTSGLLIGSYKYDKNVRLGAWVDQNLSTQNADGIKLSNNAPLFGVFGVWAERNDGLGYEVKVSAGYGDKDVTVTRTSTNEGSSKVNSRGLQSVSSYGIALDSNWIAAPYVGVKYVSLKRGAYAEGGSSALTYDNLRQESTSVIAGVKFTGKIDPKTFTVLSAGVEQDLNNNVGQYSAGSSNTTAFNSNVQKTRPVVSAGVYYDIDKTQRVGFSATHRQEAFQSTASTTALATYTVGF